MTDEHTQMHENDSLIESFIPTDFTDVGQGTVLYEAIVALILISVAGLKCPDHPFQPVVIVFRILVYDAQLSVKYPDTPHGRDDQFTR